MQLSALALAASALISPALGVLNPRDNPILNARYSIVDSPASSGSFWSMFSTTPSSSTSSSGSRFRNSQTEQYLVSSLPEVNFEFGEMYAGAIPLDSSTPKPTQWWWWPWGGGSSTSSDEMFFIFMPKEGGEPVDELTIWLQGGPGCSSMLGFLQEVGPISWQPGTQAPTRNMYAWTNLTNVLFVDQPIGTGFSTGTVTAASEEDVARQFLGFVKQFQSKFGISNFKVYVTGESYGGRYVPYIADAMIDAKDPEHFNVSGALLIDPAIGNSAYVQQQMVAYPYIEERWNDFRFNQTDMAMLKQSHQQCGYEQFIADYLTFPARGVQPPLLWDRKNRNNPFTIQCDVYNAAMLKVLTINPCFDPYYSSRGCPILSDVLGMSGMLQGKQSTTLYFDRADVQSALHVPNKRWAACSDKAVFTGGNGIGGPQQNGDMSMDSIQGALPRVIDATQRVLIANGDLDYAIIRDGTLLSIQNMTWGGVLGFQNKPEAPLYVNAVDVQNALQTGGSDAANSPQGKMGYQHFERGLMWNQVFAAGHMIPTAQPRVAYMQLEWVLRRRDSMG